MTEAMLLISAAPLTCMDGYIQFDISATAIEPRSALDEYESKSVKQVIVLVREIDQLKNEITAKNNKACTEGLKVIKEKMNDAYRKLLSVKGRIAIQTFDMSIKLARSF